MLDVIGLRRTGLSEASFSLAAGECLVVQGESGAGKSLLLRAIADLDPNEGTVRLKGRDRLAFSGPDWRRLVGYLPAEPGWWADRVGQHFADWGAALPLLDRLALPADCRDWPLTRPSTGERMRLALIRALAAGPEVLLLDEPTASLDGTSVAAVEALVAERRSAGLAVLWVTHDAGQAERLGGRRLVVSAGRVAERLSS